MEYSDIPNPFGTEGPLPQFINTKGDYNQSPFVLMSRIFLKLFHFENSA